jgi:23S rRNA pseudouridine955/2504/2580 synthase
MKKLKLKDIILFENEDFLALNKPSGISTLEDRSDAMNVLLLVKELYPQIKNCHRLDKYTSGVLLFAKNPDSYRSISLQFQNRQVQKIYHAIVHGQPDFSGHEVNVPLIIKNTGIVIFDTKRGKEANTFFTTLKKFKSCSLVECRPVTGRKHQIRVHLKYAKHPIIADGSYGGELIYLSQLKRKYIQTKEVERPMIDRMALHAVSLEFKDSEGKSIAVEAPYPKDFRIALSQLEKYG